MKPPQFLSDSTARAVRPGLAAQSLESVTQRLARAEEALGLQFTRIAQLQAQLDVVLGGLRRSAGGDDAASRTSVAEREEYQNRVPFRLIRGPAGKGR